MEILSLTDNLCALPGCKAQHGLSLYIKTKKHKILFDLGQDGTFIRNAQKLGVDIADVDIVIISHGHYDHGGSLADFLKHNSKAKIYIRKDDPYTVIVFHMNTGYFAAEKLSERHRELILIMISDSQQYVVDAFRLHVSDFWLYPYTAERVEEAFRHLRHTPEKESQFS